MIDVEVVRQFVMINIKNNFFFYDNLVELILLIYLFTKYHAIFVVATTNNH